MTVHPSPTAHREIGCINAAASILGDKWTPVLLRSIYNNQKIRFCQLQDGVGGINPRTLTARLASLESQGIIERCAGTGTLHGCYTLSKKGEALMPILQSMAEWGETFAADTV